MSVRNCEDDSRILHDVHRNTFGLRHPMKLVPFATRVRMDVKSFPSRRSVPLLITHSIVHHCGLRHSMKLVPFATRVRMDVKAFLRCPVCLCLSQIHKQGIRYCL
ncbi:hypothetical protein T06_10298 [Trichinella sp. T6]|nr:hypothetical protein T06_10298 [Trichinella sp. T6]